MSTAAPPSGADAVIIGGGIAGLTAAYTLKTAGWSPVMLEKAPHVGGKLSTEHIAGFTIEHGPDAFLMRKPWAYQLAQHLGLEPYIIHTRPENHHTYVLRKGQLYPLPTGFHLVAPTDLRAFLRSPILSLRGRLRALLDLVLPAHPPDSTDESLGALIRRRLGHEVADTLVEPLLGGVYNAPIDTLSSAVSFPKLRELEVQHGSLIRGLQHTRRAANQHSQPAFFSFIGGAQTLTDALINALDGHIFTGIRVSSITRAQTGTLPYAVQLADGQIIHTSNIILALPAQASASLLSRLAPQAANLLSAQQTTDVAVAALGYHQHDVPHPLNGLGVVIPPSEGRAIDGMTWASSKWTHRAPDGHVLIRVFFGGPHTRHTYTLNDTEALALIRQELAQLLGIRAEPVVARLIRWPAAYPLYTTGHLDRQHDIECALPIGIHITGSSLYGVGVPDVVHHALETAQKLIQHGGIYHANPSL
jgi:oxygen-dependent protoporphyrinogen oxidase